MTTNAATKKARLLGTTDASTTCDLCGRVELKRTVVIEFTNTGEIVHAGTDCAARALGWTESTVRTRARSADNTAYDKAWEHYVRECDRIDSEWDERYRTWLRTEYGTDNDRISGPLVSRPREKVALTNRYKTTTGDAPTYPTRPERPAHLRR